MLRPKHRIKVSASLLSADFGRLGEQAAEVAEAGADYIHVDVMDGHFVSPITIGPLVIKGIRPWTTAPLDVHMMVSEPGPFVSEIVEAGADIVTVHAEACIHLHRVVNQIKEAGARAGVAINPATPLSALEEILPDLDMVLVMTVNPGFGGQPFIESMLGKVARVRAMLDERRLEAEIEVDGGIGPVTAHKVVDAGATVLVAGSAVFDAGTDLKDAIRRIRQSALRGLASGN